MPHHGAFEIRSELNPDSSLGKETLSERACSRKGFVSTLATTLKIGKWIIWVEIFNIKGQFFVCNRPAFHALPNVTLLGEFTVETELDVLIKIHYPHKLLLVQI